MDGPFKISVLLSALQATRKQIVPEPDGFTYTSLRNFPEQHKLVLLEWINHTGKHIQYQLSGKNPGLY